VTDPGTRVTIRAERSADRDAAAEVERLAGAFAWVAEEQEELVGHIQFSRAWIGETEVVLLGPPRRPSRSAGRADRVAQIRAGLAEAERRGEPAVILLGDPRFYGRFGGVAGSTMGLRKPAVGVQPDGFVVREEDFQIVALDGRAASLSGEVR
jgi:predicted N-acetyltransferase YhbS